VQITVANSETLAYLAITVEAGMPYDGKGNKVPQHQQVDTRAQVQRKLTYSRCD